MSTTMTSRQFYPSAAVLLWMLTSIHGFSVNPRLAQSLSSPTALDASIGVFFGTSTGSTEEAAELICAEFGDDAEGPFEIDGIQGSVAAEFSKYDALVVGTPTWNTGADTERSGTGWDEVYYGEMADLDVAGKKVAVFGLGDSVSYAENYADASGELHDVFENLGGKMLGYTSQVGYEHEDSKAIRGDLFCGLLLDAVNQEEMTEQRVQNWVAQLKGEGILEAGEASGVPVVSQAVPTIAETPVSVVAPVAAVSSNDERIANLELENAKLRKKLEENSSILDEAISDHSSDPNGYTPHFNAQSGRTMWTSSDGRSCYYTASMINTMFSP